ncbi:hypothetical protein GH714_003321 [Hevea brasiliensis]|uniref:MULE transposase domain-containing protein n=1 Tax=Hevea brasiliensis TaxID=3981 RepID=A0A6A6LJH5_HEVBR|nr:hypothetical protein GH714_003321 [Hevea brasiliensis]
MHAHINLDKLVPGVADCFFDMNEDIITNNDHLHTSANGDDIGEDIIRHDNQSQMPNAKDDGIGQTVGNRSEVESAHEPDVREAAIPGVDLVDEDYDMVSGDEDVATVFNDIDKENVGGRPKDSQDDDCCRLLDFNAENDIKDPTFQIGMLFKNIYEFKEACRAYGIKHRRNPKDTADLTMQIKAGKFMHIYVAIDPNDCIFPLAYAVIRIECGESWKWFLEMLKNDLQMHNSFSWTFISDRQKGLIGAVSELFPNAEHRRWDLNGIPCAHACSVIFANDEHPEDYIPECYKVDTYAKVYAHYINPINGYEMWPRPSIRYSFTHPVPIEKKKANEYDKRYHEVDGNISTHTTKGKRATSAETYKGNTRITTQGQASEMQADASMYHSTMSKLTHLVTLQWMMDSISQILPRQDKSQLNFATLSGLGQAKTSNREGASHTSKRKERLNAASKLKIFVGCSAGVFE